MTEKKYELRKQIKTVRWMIFWVVLAQFAAQTAVEAVVSFMAEPPHQYIRVAVIELIALGVPITIYAKTAWNGRTVKRAFCLNRCNGVYLVFAAILGVCGQFAMMVLNIPASFVMELIRGAQDTDAGLVATKWEDVALGVFCVVIIPAVIEEFLMRGIIFRAYSRGNTIAAVLFTSIIFALLHFQLDELIGFFFMGVISSLLLLKSNSLYTSMVYHAFSNLTALLFGIFIMPGIIDALWIVIFGLIAVLVICLMVLLKLPTKMTVHRNFKARVLIVNGIFSFPVILSVLLAALKYVLFNVAR